MLLYVNRNNGANLSVHEDDLRSSCRFYAEGENSPQRSIADNIPKVIKKCHSPTGYRWGCFVVIVIDVTLKYYRPLI